VGGWPPVVPLPWYTIPPSGYGGIEWAVALLAGGLTDRGYEVALFARVQDRGSAGAAIAGGAAGGAGMRRPRRGR
jgi:hypothetical protein